MEINSRRAVCCCIVLASFLIAVREIMIYKPVQQIYFLKSFEDRKVIKRCFRLSFKTRNLEELSNINLALDIGNTIYNDTGPVESEVIWKRNTTDFRSCSQFVTLPDYNGRMGNQMFETASVIGLAYKYDAIPVIPSWLPLRKYFELPNVVDTKQDKLVNIVDCTMNKSGKFVNCSKEFSFQANVSVHGYRQSWKYFADIREIIRTVFKFKSKHVLNAKRFLSSVSQEGFQHVCIHVRRGDFSLSSQKQAGRLMADRDYIKRAKNIFIEKYKRVQFFVVSDDKNWCRQNIENVTISPLTDPGDEMALMMLSDHVIMTVGSYGWWGAWLSGGTVVYLKSFARPGSRLESRIVIEDYFPNTWIGIT